MKLLKMFLFFLAAVGTLSCVSEGQLKDKVAKILKENPKVLTDAIEANPAEFVEAVQKAAKNAQQVLAKKREQDEAKKLEATYDNPLKPVIRSDESIRGTKGAPITLVEYSDFECPFCTRGFKTVQEIMKAYPGKVAFVFKHLPLSFHKQAMVASRYFEAIRLDDEKKAFKFHDEIFDNQRQLRNGEAFLKKVAKKVGANMTKLAKNLKDPKVQQRIDEDMKEAASFGMQGTPGFIINGVPVKGAYPFSHFKTIIDELVKRGKLSL
ncbi:MAG: thioredoxin domain-containing protein [Bacteriovoracaceae bacterium]|nr:thioredoxin domain-containing protein [Bacteriovoracaceae bacterium]